MRLDKRSRATPRQQPAAAAVGVRSRSAPAAATNGAETSADSETSPAADDATTASPSPPFEESPSLELLLKHRAEFEQALHDVGDPNVRRRRRRLGRMSARERIEALMDPGTCVEIRKYQVRHPQPPLSPVSHEPVPGDAVICALGKVNGAPIAAYAHDGLVHRGTTGVVANEKIVRLLDLARDRGLPVITLADSEGARVGEGSVALRATTEVLRRTALLRGRVPQITVACGLCVGAAAYNAALNDAVAMVDGQSYMFLTGSKVSSVVTGESMTIDQLGGPDVHFRQSGVCHAVVDDEMAGINWVKRLLDYCVHAYVPTEDSPARTSKALETIIPAEMQRGYDVLEVIDTLLDADSFFELRAGHCQNLVTGFARLGGHAVAVLASQPTRLAGALDAKSSLKGARFIQWADSLRIPLLNLVDVPGYFPGLKEELEPVLTHGAALIDAYSRATVPQLCLILRKCYGGGGVLASDADIRLALPTARCGAMGTLAAEEVILGHCPDGASKEEQDKRRDFRVRWQECFDTAWSAAREGYIDAVVEPQHARLELHRALESLLERR